MKSKTYLLVTSAIFLIVAVAHLLRLLFRCPISLCGSLVPYWISIPGLVVPALLSGWGFSLASKVRSTP